MLLENSRPDPPAAGALSDVLGLFTGRLRNLDAWSALLSAGTQRPATLGIRLMPVLCSGQLLRADPASRAAAGLIQAVAPDLDDDEHGRLEAAIVSIPAAGYAGHLRDRLLGALDRARISDPRAKQRLTALDAEGGPPRIEGPVIGSFRDISLAPPGPHAAQWPVQSGAVRAGGPQRAGRRDGPGSGRSSSPAPGQLPGTDQPDRTA